MEGVGEVVLGGVSEGLADEKEGFDSVEVEEAAGDGAGLVGDVGSLQEQAPQPVCDGEDELRRFPLGDVLALGSDVFDVSDVEDNCAVEIAESVPESFLVEELGRPDDIDGVISEDVKSVGVDE